MRRILVLAVCALLPLAPGCGKKAKEVHPPVGVVTPSAKSSGSTAAPEKLDHESRPSLTGASLTAYDSLRTSKRFTITSAFGIGMEFPSELRDFQTLLKDPNAKDGFRHLVDLGTPEGQLYGLCGLYFADTAEFAAQLPAFQAKTGSVNVMEGAIIRPTSIASMVKSQSLYTVKLAGPNQTVDQWVKVNHLEGKPYRLDIAGGGYPSFLKEAKPLRPGK